MKYNSEFSCVIHDQYPDYYNQLLPISLYEIQDRNTPSNPSFQLLTRSGVFSTDTTSCKLPIKLYHGLVMSNKSGYLLFYERTRHYTLVNPTLNSHFTYCFSTGNFRKLLTTADDFYVQVEMKTYRINSNNEPLEVRKLENTDLIEVVDNENLLINFKGYYSIYNIKNDSITELPNSALKENINKIKVFNHKITAFTSTGVYTYPLK